MDDIHAMMQSPWTYVVLAILIGVVAVPLVAVRVLAARQKRSGDQGHDRHLG